MKILHTIASMASQSGGTTACTRELVQALNDLGCATDILTVEDRPGVPRKRKAPSSAPSPTTSAPLWAFP